LQVLQDFVEGNTAHEKRPAALRWRAVDQGFRVDVADQRTRGTPARNSEMAVIWNIMSTNIA